MQQVIQNKKYLVRNGVNIIAINDESDIVYNLNYINCSSIDCSSIWDV